MFWVFKLSFVVDILAFLACQLFGLFLKKLVNFFPIISGLYYKNILTIVRDDRK
jgi:hypothetical protein